MHHSKRCLDWNRLWKKNPCRQGQNKERVVLTVRGFKELCVMAGTEHGKRLRHYS
jgi:phage anti-repressor protein